MQNNSIETLLLRHYGNSAPASAHLEQRLVTALHRDAHQMQRKQHLTERRISRRQVVRLVAMGSAGVGLLSAGVASLQQFETALLGQDAKPALS